MMKTRLIVNPVSGTDSAPDYLQTINERLRARFGEMDIVMTVGPKDAERAARQAALNGYENLFIAGGDGTLNEVINGVSSVDKALERITFGLIPLGTGNDFAGALGLPEEVDAALDVLLLEGRTIKADVGVLNDRFFINVSAGGFIAEVSSAVNSELKSIAGKLAYLIGGAQVLMDYEHVEVRLRVVEGEQVITRQMSMEMFAVCNSRLVGGGRLIAPHAIINDGFLDVCIIEAMPTLEFIGLLTDVSSGDHIEDERVSYFHARELELQFDHPIKVNTDGEVLETDHCRYKILPQAARFLSGDAPYALG